MSKSWSTLQEAIFNFCQNGQGNAIVNAVAGSGKTTTIVEAINRISGSSIFLAFNKSIAEELKSRGVNARTFHSLTYVPVTQFKNTRTVEPDKLRKLQGQTYTQDEMRMYGPFVAKLVGLARQSGFRCLVNEDRKAWDRLIDHYNLDLENEQADMNTAIDMATELLTDSIQSSMVDFDDLLYLTVLEKLSLPKYDFVFVDEAQDTNAIQRAILKKIMKPTTRIVAVGDPAQAIYGFRGADSDSLELIKRDFKAIELPLSISYRCPQDVVKYAQEWVNHIQASPTAPKGEVTHLGDKWFNKHFVCGDLVVCRRTAPLITLAYSLMRDRIGVQVLGRDIGEGLKGLIKRMQAGNLDRLINKLEIYREREVKKLMDKDQDAKAEAIKDRVDCIIFLAEELPENARSIEELLRVLDELFSDKKGCVTLSTIHKAKGLEADRVFWYDSDYHPSWPMKPWQMKQEDNLCYVAVTRAKKALFTFQPKEKKVKK